jgi:hypothetical protein
MEKLEKGCVYFFRHIGLTPIKIGYSLNESPIDRFNQFKTFAPYGSEIIGFIQTTEAKKIESLLHSKYSSKRINGEWFEITEDEAIYEINFYTKVEEVNERNIFQQKYAEYLKNKKTIIYEKVKEINSQSKKDIFLNEIKQNKNLNFTRMSMKLGVARQTLYNWKKEIELND